ncbi:hypothetical protein FJZ19_05850 [Candidatus Pacearchaeota archaeon]|nr:hypothetical protein [Candidatus Pacearchaeota archaeon]
MPERDFITIPATSLKKPFSATNLVKLILLLTSQHSRVSDLVSIIPITEDTSNNSLEIMKEGEDFYIRCVVDRQKAIEAADQYFGGETREPFMNEQLKQAVGNTSCKIIYSRKFDNVVQVAGIGELLGTVTGGAWGIYGHIIVPKLSV